MQMKIDSLTNALKNTPKKSTSKQPDQLKDMLSTILNIVENFEKHGKFSCKAHRERMDILKSFITDFIKDEEQKRIIMGEKMKDSPYKAI